ncbi:uncharacterized protein G2W53_008107 [Senna tora]|uniref:RNase H type-1 domain-containing protein n=1 Tax=Senna tora TaxID=362788 RepID=A0A835CGM8_9FABA|nr:uncharacterized protein G2W53_008107 [Senna tora]
MHEQNHTKETDEIAILFPFFWCKAWVSSTYQFKRSKRRLIPFEPGRTTRATKLSQPSFNTAAFPRLEFSFLITETTTHPVISRHMMFDEEAGNHYIRGVKDPNSMLNHEVAELGASKISNDEWSVGVVARDGMRDLIFVAASKIHAPNDLSLAEALALRWAMGIACHNELMDVAFETDCLVVVNSFHNGNRNASSFENVVQDCEYLSKGFNSFTLTHVKRDGNNVAHHVAKTLPSAETDFCHLWSAVIVESEHGCRSVHQRRQSKVKDGGVEV